jgi:hypothetical protein
MLLGDVVVGSCVESLFYAFSTDAYFISTRQDPTMFYRKLQVPLLCCDTEPEAWSKMVIYMSLLGRIYSPPEVDSVKVSDGEIKVVSKEGISKFFFEKCQIFDPTHVKTESEAIVTVPDSFLVLDDFELSCLGGRYKKINQPRIVNREFANKIEFYTSNRVDGADFVTDCIVESTLNQEQLSLFEYSDTTVKFIVERHLKSCGVNGTFMNLYKNGTAKYRKPRVKHVRRLVFRRDNNKYENSKNITFKRMSLKEILDEVCP